MDINLKLTTYDLVDAQKILDANNRQIRRWPWFRLLGICMSTLPFFVAGFAGYTLYNLKHLDYGLLIEPNDPLTIDIFKFCMDDFLIRIYCEIFFVFFILINITIGWKILTTVIALWRGPKQDALALKVARAIVAAAETETMQNNNTSEDNTSI